MATNIASGKIRRTAIYLRVSTDKQAKEGDSIQAQRDALRKYIDDHDNLIFTGEYLDDGISGTKADRDEYQRMLSDVQAGRIDLLLVTKLDRIHRGLKNFLLMQETLDKCRCDWLAIWEPIYDSSTPQGRLIINQMMSIAQFEAENTGQRIRQVFAHKLQNKEYISRNPPIGYSVVDKHLVPNGDATVIQQAFEKYSKTGKLFETGRFLADHGFTRHERTVKQLLRNRTYIGEHRGIVGYCQPIIDQDLFEDVQRKLSINVKKSQKYTYIFSGLLVCADCGCNMSAYLNSARNGKVYPRYRCRQYYSPINRQCENGKGISDNALEKLLLDRLPDLIEEEQRTVAQDREKIQDNSKKIAAIRKKIDRLKDLYLAEEISMSEYKSDKAAYLEELALLEDSQPEPQKDYSRTLQIFRDAKDTYSTKTQEECRAFWRSIIRKITIDKDRNITVEFL